MSAHRSAREHAARRVLVCCPGNTCRSPTFAAVLSAIAPPFICADSAALSPSAHANALTLEYVRDAARTLGLPRAEAFLARHRPRSVLEVHEEADAIVLVVKRAWTNYDPTVQRWLSARASRIESLRLQDHGYGAWCDAGRALGLTDGGPRLGDKGSEAVIEAYRKQALTVRAKAERWLSTSARVQELLRS